jgi:hypothetical protein
MAANARHHQPTGAIEHESRAVHGVGSMPWLGLLSFRSFIGFATMANRNDVHQLPLIVHRIHYPILADSNPPEIALPAQFATTSWTWISR